MHQKMYEEAVWTAATIASMGEYLKFVKGIKLSFHDVFGMNL